MSRISVQIFSVQNFIKNNSLDTYDPKIHILYINQKLCSESSIDSPYSEGLEIFNSVHMFGLGPEG